MLQLEALASELTIAKVKAGKAMCLFTQEILANAFTVRIQRKRYVVQSTMIGKGSVVVPSNTNKVCFRAALELLELRELRGVRHVVDTHTDSDANRPQVGDVWQMFVFLPLLKLLTHVIPLSQYPAEPSAI